jgi:hypothetical protein
VGVEIGNTIRDVLCCYFSARTKPYLGIAEIFQQTVRGRTFGDENTVAMNLNR